MNIAFCISGHMRGYLRMKPNFDKFKQHISKFGTVDVFVSTWDKQTSTGCWSENNNHQDLSKQTIPITMRDVEGNYNTTAISVFDNDFYSSVDSPIKNNIITEYSLHNDRNEWSYNGTVHGMKQMFLVYQSMVLKKHAEFSKQIKYDLVFRIRPDYLFKLDYIQELPLDINENTLYCYANSSIDDQFYYGSSFTMDRVMSSFLRGVQVLPSWWGCNSAFDNLVRAYHPSIKFHVLTERPGVIPNDPIPVDVEFLDSIKDVQFPANWSR